MRSFALLSTMAAAASAAPAYIPYAYNTSVPEIHGKPVAANNLELWINKPTTATCPSYDPDCASQNTTIISGPTDGQSGNAQFWLGILEAGGQGLYTNIPGLLQFAAADTNNKASTTKPSFGPFYVEQSAAINQTVLRFTVPDDNGKWAACADDDGAFSIWAYGSGGYASNAGPCYDFEMTLEETDAPAVQYYN